VRPWPPVVPPEAGAGGLGGAFAAGCGGGGGAWRSPRRPGLRGRRVSRRHRPSGLPRLTVCLSDTVVAVAENAGTVGAWSFSWSDGATICCLGGA
jgi:hypothetical protein